MLSESSTKKPGSTKSTPAATPLWCAGCILPPFRVHAVVVVVVAALVLAMGRQRSARRPGPRRQRHGAELDEAIKALGAMPLPPYIEARREVEERDRIDYQTVYATVDQTVIGPADDIEFRDNAIVTINGAVTTTKSTPSAAAAISR